MKAGPLPGRLSEMRSMARFAVPLATAQAAIILMSVVDTLFVGRYDAVHLSGVGVGGALSHGILVFGMGIAFALEPLVAQALGAGEAGRAFAWWRTGARLTLIMSIPLTALVLLGAYFSEIFGVEPAIADQAFSYALWRTPANLLFLYWLAARAVLQSQQRTRPLLFAALLANIVNAAADAILVDGVVTLGAAGAGLATSLSTVILFVVASRAIALSRPDALTPADGLGPPPSARRLLNLGLPVSLQLAAEFGMFSSVGIIAASIGAVEGAAHQIALNCATLTFMFAAGIGGAAGARVSEAVGRGDSALARRRAGVAVLLALGVMATSAVLFAVFAEPLAALFSADDEPEVQALSVQLLMIASLFQLFDGAQVVIAGVLRGVGDVKVPLLITLGAYWAVGFLVGMLLAFEGGLGARGLWFGLSAGLCTSSLGLGWRTVVVFRSDIARLT